MNVYKIVLLPSNTFDYTTFATCILFMRKGEVTNNVEFRELKLKEVNIDGQKQKVIDQDILLGNVTIEQIIGKNYSLKPDDYFKVEEEKQDTTGWVKLGDVCDIIKGKSLTIANMINGNYKVIGGGYIPMKETHNEYNVNEKEILISNDGAYAGYLNIFNEQMFITSHCNKIIPKENINKYYLWYYLKLNQHDIINNYQCGQAQPSLDKNKLNKEFLIPNLSQEHQEEIVKFLDDQFTKYDINKLKKNIPLFKLLINKEYDMAAELLHLVYRQMAAEQECENIKRDIKGIFQLSVYGLKAEKKKLGDIVEYLPKKLKLKAGDGKTEGKYRFYSSSQDKVMYYDEYEFKEECILLGRGGIASVHLATKFCISHDDVYVLRPNDKKININYLYHYLINNKQLLIFTGNTGGLKHLSKENINQVKIPVPSLEVQEEIIKRIESLELQSSHYNQYAKILETELNNITEIINNITLLCKDNDEPIDETNDNNDEPIDETNDNNDEPIDETNDNNDEPVIEDDQVKIEESYEESIKPIKKTKSKKNKLQMIEYKGRTYIIENDKVYKMDEDGKKGKQYGTFINGKVKKSEEKDKNKELKI